MHGTHEGSPSAGGDDDGHDDPVRGGLARRVRGRGDDWPHLGSAPFTVVGDVRSAIEQAKAAAGDGDVSVAAGDVGGQALREGLIDQVALDLVPVVLGSGRPFFGAGGPPEVLLEDPQVVRGRRVTHLLYTGRR